MAKAKYYQRADGLFETSRTIKGKRVRFYGRTCRDVDQKILAYNEKAEKGRKVSEIADEWYKGLEKTVSLSTYKVYGPTLRRIIAEFGNQNAGHVTAQDCQRYIHDFEQEGYAKNTVNIETHILRAIFDYAVLSGDISQNPALYIKHSKNLPKTTRHALTLEQEQLVTNCRSGDFWLFGYMLLYTGCRRGELLALNWQDIDWGAGVIHITKKLNYVTGSIPILENHLKNAEARDVPILAPLADVLPRDRVGKIFHNESGEYLKLCQLNKKWEAYCSRIGLEGVTPHCFRHSMATMCLEAGLDPKAIAAIIGDTEKITDKVYTEMRKKYLLMQTEKLNTYFAEKNSAKKEG